MTQKEYDKQRRELKDQFYMGLISRMNYIRLAIKLWRKKEGISAVEFWILAAAFLYIMVQVVRALIHYM